MHRQSAHTSGTIRVTPSERLIYVNDSQAGISRTRKGKGFAFEQQGKKITDPQELERIRKIVIPPAWEKVWICRLPEGHIQATGFDTKNRKQYRYHPLWNQLRNETKFSWLLAFGEKLPQLRLQLEEDLALHGLSEKKVLAAVVSLMERTYIRVGNNAYEKLYGSYGLTTLKDRHVSISGSTLRFSFKGKKGIHHHISLRNKKLARIVKQCRDIPGRELFQYYDDNRQVHSIDSGQVNAYIKDITGEDFTAKDFRTWAGTLHALSFLCQPGDALTQAARKHRMAEALDHVSGMLGNTRTVCKKYYVHPLILDLYEKEALDQYSKQLDLIEKNDALTGWTKEERLLLEILKQSRKSSRA